MEAELVRQATILFGEVMTRRIAGNSTAAADQHVPAAIDALPESTPSTEPPENVPQLVTLQMTTKQQRRLWRHVETIDNFWESLNELEPGVIKRLAALAAERRWEIIF